MKVPGNVNLRMLSYLVALDETRHFGKAAEACFVSQPTLSAQLKKLEDLLGVALIERQPGNIMLTGVGEKVVAKARAMLQTAGEIDDIAQTSRDPFSGQLRIGLIPTLGPYLLPHVVAALRRELPHLDCRFLEYQTDPVLKRLRDGDIDVVLLALPIDDDGLSVRELFAEPFRLAVPASHEFAKRDAVEVGDLDGQSLLLLEDGHCLRDQALEVCAMSSVEEDGDFRATSLETLRHMVAAEAGITLLPALALEPPASRFDSVVDLRFVDPAPMRRIAAVWRKADGRVEALNRFADVVTASAPQLAA
ncbi:MAG: LysR substrate-binding domain-containing protein [Pseudomonadota bacterium]